MISGEAALTIIAVGLHTSCPAVCYGLEGPVDILNDFAEKKVPAEAAKAILDGQVAALAFLDSGNPGSLAQAWLPKDPRSDIANKFIDGLKNGVLSEIKEQHVPEDIRKMQEWYDKLQKVDKLADNIAKATAAP